MVTYPSVTRLIDTFIVEFNEKIVQSLTWLNNPLSKLEEISRHIDGQYVRVPAIFLSDYDYMDVLPDDNLVNYSWFKFDPIQITGNKIPAKIKTGCSLNLFLNLYDITGKKEARELENVKYQVLNAIQTLSLLSGSVRLLSISDRFKDVYSGFNITEVQDRYFMQPYACLNLKLTVYLRNNVCGVNLNQWTADTVELTADGTNFDASGAIF